MKNGQYCVAHREWVIPPRSPLDSTARYQLESQLLFPTQLPASTLGKADDDPTTWAPCTPVRPPYRVLGSRFPSGFLQPSPSPVIWGVNKGKEGLSLSLSYYLYFCLYPSSPHHSPLPKQFLVAKYFTYRAFIFIYVSSQP